MEITVTSEEQKAIRSLERLAKKWPKSLKLFSWSGALTLMKQSDSGDDVAIHSVSGIPNDGGDPSDVIQDATINYE